MYDRVKELRKAGKRPVIKLTPGALVTVPKLPTGRPRKYREGESRAPHYVGCRGKSIPRCMAKGCRQMLRMHQAAACSDVCADRIINDALLRLKACGVKKDELLELYGD